MLFLLHLLGGALILPNFQSNKYGIIKQDSLFFQNVQLAFEYCENQIPFIPIFIPSDTENIVSSICYINGPYVQLLSGDGIRIATRINIGLAGYRFTIINPDGYDNLDLDKDSSGYGVYCFTRDLS